MLSKYVSILSISLYSSLVYAPYAVAQSQMPLYEPSTSQDEELPLQGGDYRLAADDTIVVNIFDVPEFSGDNGTYTIRADGTIRAPWIGEVCLLGMTLEEAIDELTRRYQPYVNNPMLTVTVLEPRPIRVSVVGEVNRPGTYESDSRDDEQESLLIGDSVVQAIQSASGITQLADVRNIEITRPHYSCPGVVRYSSITVNLWELLQTGDIDEDLRLRDGDRIVVPTATAISEAELAEVATASFSPSTININVVGEVIDPGLVELSPNVSLNQAILAAGGFNNRRARRGSVDLIRLHPNGTVTKRNIPVDFAEGLSEDNNPPLRNNDVIIVRRSGLAAVGDTVATALSPFTTLIGGLGAIFGIINVFDDN